MKAWDDSAFPALFQSPFVHTSNIQHVSPKNGLAIFPNNCFGSLFAGNDSPFSLANTLYHTMPHMKEKMLFFSSFKSKVEGHT